MMEFKPGNGYSPSGYASPKKNQKTKMFGAFIFLIGIFGLTAVVFGWWSILIDAIILAFLSWSGRQFNKEKGLDT